MYKNFVYLSFISSSLTKVLIPTNFKIKHGLNTNSNDGYN